MIFLDTQVISYAFKGASEDNVDGSYISSVVANEFLEVHTKVPDTAAYYVPISGAVFNKAGHLGSLLQSIKDRYKKRPFPKASTDKLGLYFGQEHPTVVEYGSFAMSRLINEKALMAFKLIIASLDKRKQRKLINRFEFIVDTGLTCTPLTSEDARLAQVLLYDFKKKHTLKNNFRNSISDILIMASAIKNEAELVTKDSLLASFCENNRLISRKKHGNWVRCESILPEINARKMAKESKGYINKSWQVRVRKGQGVGNIA